MAKRWRVHSHDAARVADFERAAGIPYVVAQLLLCRGIGDPRLANDFLEAKLSTLRDPELLPGCAQAADRISAAIKDRRKITVYGDYDADGMTATAILLLCLRNLGADANFFVPNRLDEGYGLGGDALRNLAAAGTQMVITVDCGIASLDEARLARELGLELIVTDHHEMKDQLPDAAAIVHPRLPGSTYPFAGLSGAGVAFKVAWAVAQRASDAARVSPIMRDFLMQALALAALGTVADVVPLVDENRVLVRHGLRSLKHRPLLGLEKLMCVTKLDKKSSLECEDLGFCLGPRLNAAGRLGQAQLAVELLTTNSPERATALAEYLHELNSSRDSLERSVYLAAHKQATEEFDPENDAALVLAGRGWHAGVIGLVAGRLADKFNRPVVLIAQDPLGVKPGVGSARSVPGFNLHTALEACTQYLVTHGGHAAAAGLKVDDPMLDEFRAEFCAHASAELQTHDRVAELRIDAETLLSALTREAVEQLEQLAPFGHGNARPVLCTSDVRLAEPPKRIGGGGRHLSLKVTQHGVTLRGVAFGGGDWADELAGLEGTLHLAFRPIINEFNGRRTVELQVVDWHPAGAPAVALAGQAADR